MAQNQNVAKLRQEFLKQHQAEINQARKLGQDYQRSFTAAQQTEAQGLQQQAQAQMQKFMADPKMSQAGPAADAAAICRDAQRQSSLC